jgi:hypothetical protein
MQIVDGFETCRLGSLLIDNRLSHLCVAVIDTNREDIVSHNRVAKGAKRFKFQRPYEVLGSLSAERRLTQIIGH